MTANLWWQKSIAILGGWTLPDPDSRSDVYGSVHHLIDRHTNVARGELSCIPMILCCGLEG